MPTEPTGFTTADLDTNPATSGRPEPEREVAALKEELDALKRHAGRLEAVADLLGRVQVWDYSLYEQLPDEQWVAVDREDWQMLSNTLARIDRWAPWQTVLERRLGDL